MPQSSTPLILALETSGPTCSVALQLGDGAIALRVAEGENDHSRTLTPLIEGFLSKHAMSIADLDAIAFSAGPGSYTGLRIGYSVAKGLSFGASIPMIEVPTLTALAGGLLIEIESDRADEAVLVPMMDARRMEVYTQTFSWSMAGEMAPYSEGCPLVLTERLPPVPEGAIVYYGGSGAQKAKELLQPKGWTLVEHQLSARDLLPTATQKYQNHEYANTAYCEPHYFKDFIAQTAKPGVLDAARARGNSRPNS